MYLGPIVAAPLTAWTIQNLGWQVVFYAFGALGLLLGVVWWFGYRDNPREHPLVTEQEVAYIAAGQPEEPAARDLLRTLEARELTRTAAYISARTGLEHLEVKTGDKLTGVYRRTLTLTSGRYALIERSHDFALVPWRPVRERARGQMGHHL